jgi:hypothetical protein
MAMKLSRHPTPHQLQAWLETGGSAKLGKHIDTCERCMAALEELSDLDDGLVADLTEALAAPADVEDRAVKQVESRLRNEAAFTAFVDLFAIGWSTTRTILDIQEDSNA